MSKIPMENWEAVCVQEDGKHKQWQIKPYIADVFYVTPDAEPVAKLLAAAPDLLRALKTCRDYFVKSMSNQAALDLANAAITKAEGVEDDKVQ